MLAVAAVQPHRVMPPAETVGEGTVQVGTPEQATLAQRRVATSRSLVEPSTTLLAQTLAGVVEPAPAAMLVEEMRDASVRTVARHAQATLVVSAAAMS